MIQIKNLSIKAKIFGTILIFQLLALMITILGTIGLYHIENDLDEVAGIFNQANQKYNLITYSLEMRRNLILKLINSSSKKEFNDITDRLNIVETNIEISYRDIKDFINNSKLIQNDKSINSLKKVLTDIESELKIISNMDNSIRNQMSQVYGPLAAQKQYFQNESNQDYISMTTSYLELQNNLKLFSDLIYGAINRGRQDVNETSLTIKIILWAGYFISVIIMIFVTLLMVKRIANPVKETEKLAKNFAEGDLTIEFNSDSKDEIGRLSLALNRAAGNFKNLIKKIGDSIDMVASSAEELSATSRNLAEGASNQAATLEETAAAITQISESVNNVSTNASEQAIEANETTKLMNELSSLVKEVAQIALTVKLGSQSVLEEAQDGHKKVDESVKRMAAIEESSEQISEIINVINDISDQTNLLALNAAIEAARAGESGRGFAVVAEEISKLASRSQKATQEIADLITESIQKVADGQQIVGQVVESLNKILHKSKEAAILTEKIANFTKKQNESSERVVKSIASLTNMASTISTAAKEQQMSTKEMATAVEEVNNIAQNNAASSEEMAASTSELASLSEVIRELMANFKIN